MIMEPSLFPAASFGEQFFEWHDEFQRTNGRKATRTECIDQLNVQVDLRDRQFRGTGTKVKRSERDPIFDALCAFEGVDPKKVTESHAKEVSKLVSELLKATPDVTPAEVAKRGKAYGRAFRDVLKTSRALVRHWASLAPRQKDAGGPSLLDRAYATDAPTNWEHAARAAYPGFDANGKTWADLSVDLRVNILKHVK